MLLAERGHIDSSHQMTDEILECVHPSLVPETRVDHVDSYPHSTDRHTRPELTLVVNERLSLASTLE